MKDFVTVKDKYEISCINEGLEQEYCTEKILERGIVCKIRVRTKYIVHCAKYDLERVFLYE